MENNMTEDSKVEKNEETTNVEHTKAKETKEVKEDESSNMCCGSCS
jgi:hypothetical protein